MKRGRPSAASQALATMPAPLERVDRQKPPHGLTDEEVEVWAAVVSTEPADWFSPSTCPILAQYCRHVVAAKRIAELIERATSDPDLGISSYGKLLKMQREESAIIKALATSMRITNQSTTNHRGNKVSKAARKPWES